MPRPPRWRELTLGLLALAAAGCTDAAQVSGTVRYQGKPVPAGNVIFVDQENRPTPPAVINPDGTYTAPRVPIGVVTILVGTPPPAPPETPEEDSAEWKDYRARLASHVAIPARYLDLSASGKTFDVKAGANVCDVELD